MTLKASRLVSCESGVFTRGVLQQSSQQEAHQHHGQPRPHPATHTPTHTLPLTHKLIKYIRTWLQDPGDVWVQF